MSAIAGILTKLGHFVQGSDLMINEISQKLRVVGVDVMVGHQASNVDGVDLVVASTAIDIGNPELKEAASRGIPIMRRSEMLGEISRIRKSLCVTGTHGKTTTTAMTSLVLRDAKLDPSFIIGSFVDQLESNYFLGSGEWMVIEADESDGTFLNLDSQASIVTNLESEHLDYYGSLNELIGSFRDFIVATNGPVIYCLNDPILRTLIEDTQSKVEAYSYGTDAASDYLVQNVESDRESVRYELFDPQRNLVQVKVGVPGHHVALNSCATFACLDHLGVPRDFIVSSLENYKGAKRRFEFTGEYGGVCFIDDYAHHPSEIKATLDTAKMGGWKRIHCVYQPHRYSRVSNVFQDLVRSFNKADLLYITEIYSAGEEPLEGITSSAIVDEIRSLGGVSEVMFCPSNLELFDQLRGHLEPGDLCLTLSAGDLVHIGELVF